MDVLPKKLKENLLEVLEAKNQEYKLDDTSIDNTWKFNFVPLKAIKSQYTLAFLIAIFCKFFPPTYFMLKSKESPLLVKKLIFLIFSLSTILYSPSQIWC